jgi:16S rRNA (cytosine967-C5)-methyltransferase
MKRPLSMNESKESPRRIAARIIAHWLTTQDFPDRMLPSATDNRAFIQEVVYGVSRWKGLLDYIISTLVSREPDPQSKSYLLVGLYQIFIMDSVPAHAAANETLEAAKTDLDAPRVRFINGVLRNSLRKADQIQATLKTQSLAIQTSHPDLLIKRWTKTLGADATKDLCDWNNQRPSVILRVNTYRVSMEDYRKQLSEAEILVEPHPSDPEHFLTLPSGTNVRELPGYAEGLFSIQDPATLLAVNLLNLSPGQRVLDACAAPGGKTFACAEHMQDDGLIIALDRHADRLIRLQENAKRMAFSCVRVIQADASTKPGLERIEPLGPFDRILIDVPCSNTGVLRRRPDARWRFSEDRLCKLTGVQVRLLDACSKLLAPDGAIVYSTCSLEPEENQEQLQRWVELNPEFTIDAEVCSTPPNSGIDGAFAARIIHI